MVDIEYKDKVLIGNMDQYYCIVKNLNVIRTSEFESDIII